MAIHWSRRILVVVGAILLTSSGMVSGDPVGLTNPIASKILKGEIVVGVADFLQLPKTLDPHSFRSPLVLIYGYHLGMINSRKNMTAFQ